MRTRIWLNSGTESYLFQRFECGADLTENRIIVPLRNGIEKMMDQPTHLFERMLYFSIVREEMDVEEEITGSEYFANRFFKACKTKEEIEIFISSELQIIGGLPGVCYKGRIWQFDSIMTAICRPAGAAIPTFTPSDGEGPNYYEFAMWILQNGWYTSFTNYASSTWVTRPNT